MSWEDSELQNRFTSASYNTILELCSVDDPDTQIVALQTLSDTLAYADDNLLNSFPLREMAAAMVRLLQSPVELLQENASLCIFQFLEAHTSSTRALIESGALEAIREVLMSSQFVSVHENLIRACQVISIYRPNDIGSVIGIRPLLSKFDFFRILEQRLVAQTLNQMTSQCFYDNYLESIEDMINLIHIGDQQIIRNVSSAVINICTNVSPERLSKEVIQSLLNVLPLFSEQKQIAQVMHIFLNVSQNAKSASSLIETEIDFVSFVFFNDFDYAAKHNLKNKYLLHDEHTKTDNNANNNNHANPNNHANNNNDINVTMNKVSSELQRTTFQIILSYLPNPSIPNPEGMWNNKTKNTANSKAFAERVQPVLIEILINNVEIDALAIVALAETNRLNQIFASREILHMMLGFMQQPNLWPFVLYLVLSFKDKAQFVKNGLYSILSTKVDDISNEYKAWYEKKIKELNVISNKQKKIEASSAKSGDNNSVGFKFTNYKSLLPLLNRLKTVSCFEFLHEGFFAHLTTLINDFENRQKPSLTVQSHNDVLSEINNSNLGEFLNNILEILRFLPIKKPLNDPYGGSATEIVNNSISINLMIEKSDDPRNKLDKETSFELNWRTKNLILAAEAYYNFEILHVPDNEIIENLKNPACISPRLKEIITLPIDLGKICYAELGMYHRILKTKNYKRVDFSFTSNPNPSENQEQQQEVLPWKVKPYDQIFRSYEILKIKQQQTQQEQDNGMRMAIKIKEKNDQPSLEKECDEYLNCFEEDTLSEISIPSNMIDPQMKQVLDFLKFLKEKFPGLNVRCPKFEQRINSILNSSAPYHIISAQSPAVQIVANYPFLFSYEPRCFVFKSLTMSLISVLNTVNLRLNNSKFPDDHTSHIKTTVSRENIFDDGCLLLRTLGHPYFIFDFTFEREEGIGIGPGQEFFQLMGKEFCRTTRNMWRNDSSMSDSTDNEYEKQYAFSKNGLFPSVNAPLNLFFILGKLCGKALEMGFLVPIPISKAFFKVFKGEKVTLEEIDPQLAFSVNAMVKAYEESKENTTEIDDMFEGITFIYPSNTNNNDNKNLCIELKENGKEININKDNILEYKELIEKFTINTKAVCAFRDGFSTIIQPGLWSIFESDDFIRLICGDDLTFNEHLSIKNLRENIDVSHGYTPNAPQIEYLYEIISEMDQRNKSLFMKFITGSERLPVGGLTSLRPKLTIAKKVPESPNQKADEMLPSVMTCTNYFKMPQYSTKQIMREKILIAISEGQGAFLLT